MMLAHVLCLAAGGAWLAGLIGMEQAIALGVAPFLVGSVLKSALATVTLKLLARRHRGDA
ncbi:biotin transporter BioY, partial [Halomonas sp. 707D4]